MKFYTSHLGGYMRRWIFKHPLGTVRVHNITQSDEGRDFHDHPFSFVSIILRGGYIEHRPGCDCPHPGFAEWLDGVMPGATIGPCRYYGPGSIIRRKATDLHRLELVGGSPAWTLVFGTRYFRAWGFLTPSGWVRQEQYHRSFYVR